MHIPPRGVSPGPLSKSNESENQSIPSTTIVRKPRTPAQTEACHCPASLDGTKVALGRVVDAGGGGALVCEVEAGFGVVVCPGKTVVVYVTLGRMQVQVEVGHASVLV